MYLGAVKMPAAFILAAISVRPTPVFDSSIFTQYLQNTGLLSAGLFEA